MTALRVLALDLATRTGLAHTHDSAGRERLAVRTIDAGLRPLHDQIDLIEMEVRKACGAPSGRLTNLDAKPDLVAVEGTFSRPGGSDYPLHALRANVLQWFHRQGIPYVEVAPATLKVWATGSGATRGENKVTKQRVCECIVATYGRFLHVNPRDDNAADAVAILTLTLAAYGQALTDVPLHNKRALAAVTWPTLAAKAVA